MKAIRGMGVLAVMAATAWAGGMEPAFRFEDVDVARCGVWTGPSRQPVAEEAVRTVLGLGKDDGETAAWVGGSAAGTATPVTFDYLVVLKHPVPVGTVAIDPADDPYKGSVNNGALLLLKPTVQGDPDPGSADQWDPVEFAPLQPYARFAALPPGRTVRAFLYRDVRVDGESRLKHLRAFAQRLHNVLPSGATAATTGFRGGDASAAATGGNWSTASGVKGGEFKPGNPAELFLFWDRPQPLQGLVLRSNATAFEIAALDTTPNTTPDTTPDTTPGTQPAGHPALADEARWKPVPATDRSVRHTFRWWAYHDRLYGFPAPVTTRAVRLRATAVEKGGKELWLHGLGALVDLGDRPPPAEPASDAEPPFALTCSTEAAGLATAVVDAPDGRRVRNLFAQRERRAGTQAIPWDLKDMDGAYVAPGTYRLHGIAGPMPELAYGMTPYPNVDQLWPDRTPWLQGHHGEHGWLSDHCQNWAVTAFGDEVYFGAPMAEAGVCLIACGLDGKKHWGKHDFGAWTGVSMLCSDRQAVYVVASDNVLYRLDPATKKDRKLGPVFAAPNRRGTLTCAAAFDGEVYLGFTGARHLDNAFGAGAVDLAHCLPKPPGRGDTFLRAIRARGLPPGQEVRVEGKAPQGNGNLDLETAFNEDDEQYWVLAFQEPVPIGSVVFPHPGGTAEIRLSVLRPDAPFPAKEYDESLWQPFEDAPLPGRWNCLPAPAGTTTRALRVSFTRDPSHNSDWFGRLEGLRVLRRRFANTAPAARIRTNSGTLAPDGSWDAQRATALGQDTPGIYLMAWEQPQTLSGLAIKEIDGAETEIDVWQGPVPAGDLPLDGPALGRQSTATGWRTVATYKQSRRSAYVPSSDMNKLARYLDGVAEFGGPVETRAVRLRVVAPWLDHGVRGAECRKHDGRSEHGVHYKDSYAHRLDTRACAVLGVAALRPLGGEPPVDELQYERITVYDGETGAVKRELPTKVGWHGLGFNAKGELFANSRKHDAILRIDPRTGASTPAVTGIHPVVFAVGPEDGLLYTRQGDEDGRDGVIVAYDPATGREVRTVGAPGAQAVGAQWKSDRFMQPHRLAVDRRGSLWVVESQFLQRRILQFGRTGTLEKEILGNTTYGGGGGGGINRYDGNIAWYGRLEFELDWTRHRSRPRGLLSTQDMGDFAAVRVPGSDKTYLATAPHSLQPRQPHGTVYLYDAAAGTAKLAAAMGSAEFFAPLRGGAIVSKLDGAAPKDFEFLWSDLDGNGAVDAGEVDFTPAPKGFGGVGRFDHALGCVGPRVHYRVRGFQPDGVPLYERVPLAGAPHLALDNGTYFTLGGSVGSRDGNYNSASRADGTAVWSYPAGNGVAGLALQSYAPGEVHHQFSVIGHEVAPQGDLGEFLVVHGNNGEWNLWTADGLLAGQVFLHKFHPKATFIGPAAVAPGDRLPPLTTSQEHFHGFFTRVEPTGTYYAIAGFTHMSLFEVRGLEKFKRFSQEFTVTAEDLRKARDWEATRTRRQVAARVLTATAKRAKVPPKVDGVRGGGEWLDAVPLDAEGSAEFALCFDARTLYLLWHGKGLGPIANGGTVFQRLFKTGAALEFCLGTDPAAPANRTRPVAGDLRLLVTFTAGKPRVVLYQPVAPGAAPGEAWSTRTEAGGETRFDRVADLGAKATVAGRGEADFVVEAAIPLDALGWRPKGGEQLRMDWGILTSPDGNQVKQRLYWSNKTATGTSDEAVEARLEPANWGHLQVEGGELELDFDPVDDLGL